MLPIAAIKIIGSVKDSGINAVKTIMIPARTNILELNLWVVSIHFHCLMSKEF